MSRFEQFNPDDCSQEQLNYLADSIENYLTVLTKTMVIPDELMNEYGKVIEESIKRTKKLIKRLRNGDMPLNKDVVDYR